jgi:hypothetical protein
MHDTSQRLCIKQASEAKANEIMGLAIRACNPSGNM